MTTVIETVYNKDLNKEEIQRIKNYHWDRLVKLIKPQGKLIEYPDGRVYRNDKLVAEYPDYHQQQWVECRMRGPAKSWQRWYEGLYFTEEQKKQLNFKNKDLEGLNKICQ